MEDCKESSVSKSFSFARGLLITLGGVYAIVQDAMIYACFIPILVIVEIALANIMDNKRIKEFHSINLEMNIFSNVAILLLVWIVFIIFITLG